MAPTPARVTSRHGLFWRAFADWLLGAYRRPWVWIINTLIIPAGALGAWLYVATEQTWRTQEGADLLVTSRLAARILQEELGSALAIERAMATRPTFLEAVRQRDRLRAQAALEELLALNPSIDRALLVHPDGTLWVEQTKASLEPSAQPAAFLFPPPSASGEVSGIYIDETSGTEKLVSFSYPVQANDQLLAILQLQYRLHRVGSWLEKIRIEPDGFLYVTDQQGHLVTHPFQVLPGKPKNVSSWLPVATAAGVDGTLVRFRHGHPPNAWTAAVVRLEPFGWRVIAQQPDAALLAPFHRLAWSCVGFVSAVVVLVSLLLARWARLHHTTLELMAKQASLLRHSEQRRKLSWLKTKEPPSS